jgi:hypothetical protein
MLGSSAVYRVIAVEGRHVSVEVVHAPGLVPGASFRFQAHVVEGMELVSGSIGSVDDALQVALENSAA